MATIDQGGPASSSNVSGFLAASDDQGPINVNFEGGRSIVFDRVEIAEIIGSCFSEEDLEKVIETSWGRLTHFSRRSVLVMDPEFVDWLGPAALLAAFRRAVHAACLERALHARTLPGWQIEAVAEVRVWSG